MKIRKEVQIGYWIVLGIVAFIEWTLGCEPVVGLFTAVMFAVVYAINEAILELRTRWIHRVTRRYRA